MTDVTAPRVGPSSVALYVQEEDHMDFLLTDLLRVILTVTLNKKLVYQQKDTFNLCNLYCHTE